MTEQTAVDFACKMLGLQELDPVNHPQHYTFSTIEVIDAIEAWDCGYHLGNVIKYVARAKQKGKYLEDLKKAQWYLQREIERAERDTHHPD